MGVIRCVVVSMAVIVMAVGAFAGGGTLDSLPGLKDFTAGRQSSFDPSGGNADGRQDKPILPGETRDMAVIAGAGAITHIWVTIASEDPDHLKNLVLRMYWDGEAAPSVETPIGDFFGQGNGQYYQYASMPIQIGTSHGLNSFWKMPFRKGARVTITNDGPVECGAFYYYVDYRLYKHLPRKTAYFHAQYRQAYPCKAGENYIFMEATGRGHYVGVNLSIHNRADGWWGEGDDMIYVDGETTPSFNGTGSEDYFCGAWCYGEAFSDLYLGCPLRGEHKTGAMWNVYRYHIEDPIPFKKSLKVTIEHGHANDRSDNFSSCAYWYQTEPHAAFPPLPAAKDRKPVELQIFKEKGAFEAEDMLTEFSGGPMEVQDTKSYSNGWSNAKHLWFHPAQPSSYTMVADVPEKMAGKMTVELWYTRAPDYGMVEVWVNGAKAAQWDGYNKTGVIRDKVEFPVEIGAGKNTFELRITGKNPDSTGFFAGIDCLKPKK